MGCIQSSNAYTNTSNNEFIGSDDLGGIFSMVADTNDSSEKCKHDVSRPIRNCVYLKRLIKGLRYYMTLETEPNNNNLPNRDKFIEYCMTEYTDIINDYAHLVTEHSSHLYRIYKRLINRYDFDRCDLSKCTLTERHHDNINTITKHTQQQHHEDNALFNFYVETYDSLHYYLFHLFDVGLRIEDIDLDDLDTFNNGLDNVKCVDEEFKMMQEIIQEKKKAFEAINVENNAIFNDNTKFTLDELFIDESIVKDDDEDTFIEAMFESLSENGVHYDVIETLETFFCDEEYNTDTIKDDLRDGIQCSNIIQYINYDMMHNNQIDKTKRISYSVVMSRSPSHSIQTEDVVYVVDDILVAQPQEEYSIIARQCFFFIAQYIRHITLSGYSFSTGLIFYYWPYYKNIMEQQKDIDVDNQKVDESNINDHGGYQIRELYVEQKYDDFKEEILSSGYVNMRQYNENIVLKAKQYSDTNICKSIKANRIISHNGIDDIDLHYDIKPGISLQLHHVISLILYCDFTQLSKDFSSTFRASKLNETLESIKKRNQKYWWMSKRLRETVQYFGAKGGHVGFTDIYNPIYGVRYEVKGPFYCGMSKEMVLPEFNIRLCAPTSTSAQIEVATRFSGDIGIIIQLNNNGDIWSSCHLRSFDCHWISRYKEEDERLFMGGEWRIRIESIRIIQTQQNYAKFFDALFLFDCMIEGVFMGETTTQHSVRLLSLAVKTKENLCSLGEQDTLKKLIDIALEKKEMDNIVFDRYIIDTWNLFCLKKTQIIINLHYLWRYFYILSDLIMYSVEQGVSADKKFDSALKMEKRNLFLPLLYELFKNVKKIIIYSNYLEDSRHVISYPLSLMDLLSSLECCSNCLNEIVIKASWRNTWTGWKRSWLRDAYDDFTANNTEYNGLYEICLKESNDKEGHKQDCLIISISKN